MRRVLLFCAALFAHTSPASAAPPEFHPIGQLGGNTLTLPIDMSDDGSVVLGDAIGASFRWTKQDGIQPISIPNSLVTYASDVSGDGTAIFGQSFNLSQGQGLFRLSGQGDATYPIAAPEFNYPFGTPLASADERTFALSHTVNNATAEYDVARWTVDGGMQYLGDFPGGDIRSSANDMSADGSTIVGVGEDEFGTRAFRWTAAEGFLPIIENDNREYSTVARAVSVDGSVVVGFGPLLEDVDGPWRWTRDGGPEILTRQGEAPSSGWAMDVSDDGSRVVGIDIGRGAFLWTESTGIVDIQDLLINRYGLQNELAGWDLFTADVISANGKVVAGTGFDSSGQLTGWVATVPEPSGVALVLITCGAALVLRRVRRPI